MSTGPKTTTADADLPESDDRGPMERTLASHTEVEIRNARPVQDVDVEPREQLPTSLSESEMKVYRSIEEHGLTPSEYADTVDVSTSTVRTQLSRARSKVEVARQ